MKKLTVLLLATISLGAFAQNRKSNVKQAVSDDGKTMHITVKSNKDGKEINYDRTFAVTGMSKPQKDALLKRVNDSLGVTPPPAPPAPHKSR